MTYFNLLDKNAMFSNNMYDYSIGLYEDFLWKISLWNTKNSRISRDVILTSENFNDVHVFEIPDVNLKEQNGHTYMYIDLVHRYVQPLSPVGPSN